MVIAIQLPESQRRKLVEFIMKVTGASEDDAERIERIISKYPPRKILVALNTMLRFDWKRARRKPISLEELERILERVRY